MPGFSYLIVSFLSNRRFSCCTRFHRWNDFHNHTVDPVLYRQFLNSRIHHCGKKPCLDLLGKACIKGFIRNTSIRQLCDGCTGIAPLPGSPPAAYGSIIIFPVCYRSIGCSLILQQELSLPQQDEILAYLLDC